MGKDGKGKRMLDTKENPAAKKAKVETEQDKESHYLSFAD